MAHLAREIGCGLLPLTRPVKTDETDYFCWTSFSTPESVLLSEPARPAEGRATCPTSGDCSWDEISRTRADDRRVSAVDHGIDIYVRAKVRGIDCLPGSVAGDG